jgi:hypothetical protein
LEVRAELRSLSDEEIIDQLSTPGGVLASSIYYEYAQDRGPSSIMEDGTVLGPVNYYLRNVGVIGTGKPTVEQLERAKRLIDGALEIIFDRSEKINESGTLAEKIAYHPDAFDLVARMNTVTDRVTVDSELLATLIEMRAIDGTKSQEEQAKEAERIIREVYQVVNAARQGRGKYVSDVRPIQVPSGTIIKSREQLDSMIEEPLLEAMRVLFDKNIETIDTSANYSNVPMLGGAYAHIYVSKRSLNQTNLKRLTEMSKNPPQWKYGAVKIGVFSGDDSINIEIPIVVDTSVGELSKMAVAIASEIESQKSVLSPRAELRALPIRPEDYWFELETGGNSPLIEFDDNTRVKIQVAGAILHSIKYRGGQFIIRSAGSRQVQTYSPGSKARMGRHPLNDFAWTGPLAGAVSRFQAEFNFIAPAQAIISDRLSTNKTNVFVIKPKRLIGAKAVPGEKNAVQGSPAALPMEFSEISKESRSMSILNSASSNWERDHEEAQKFLDVIESLPRRLEAIRGRMKQLRVDEKTRYLYEYTAAFLVAMLVKFFSDDPTNPYRYQMAPIAAAEMAVIELEARLRALGDSGTPDRAELREIKKGIIDESVSSVAQTSKHLEQSPQS